MQHKDPFMNGSRSKQTSNNHLFKASRPPGATSELPKMSVNLYCSPPSGGDRSILELSRHPSSCFFYLNTSFLQPSWLDVDCRTPQRLLTPRFLLVDVLKFPIQPVKPAVLPNLGRQKKNKHIHELIQLLFLLLYHSLKSSSLHCDCRGCWENYDVSCRRSGVTTCPVRIRVSRKVPKTGCEVFLSVLLDACCSSQLSMQTMVRTVYTVITASLEGSPETRMVQPISGSEFITGSSPWWQRVLSHVFESKQTDLIDLGCTHTDDVSTYDAASSHWFWWVLSAFSQ